MIFVTGYDLITKECLAPSTPCGCKNLIEAERVFVPVAGKVIRKSKRMLLVGTLDGVTALALSDYKICYE